jgi:DNA-directed RNA polymerase subunit RPC12/RpoP
MSQFNKCTNCGNDEFTEVDEFQLEYKCTNCHEEFWHSAVINTDIYQYEGGSRDA